MTYLCDRCANSAGHTGYWCCLAPGMGAQRKKREIADGAATLDVCRLYEPRVVRYRKPRVAHTLDELLGERW